MGRGRGHFGPCIFGVHGSVSSRWRPFVLVLWRVWFVLVEVVVMVVGLEGFVLVPVAVLVLVEVVVLGS